MAEADRVWIEIARRGGSRLILYLGVRANVSDSCSHYCILNLHHITWRVFYFPRKPYIYHKDHRFEGNIVLRNSKGVKQADNEVHVWKSVSLDESEGKDDVYATVHQGPPCTVWQTLDDITMDLCYMEDGVEDAALACRLDTSESKSEIGKSGKEIVVVEDCSDEILVSFRDQY